MQEQRNIDIDRANPLPPLVEARGVQWAVLDGVAFVGSSKDGETVSWTFRRNASETDSRIAA